MQSLWKYIDDLVGKGLDLLTICQFLWYASASMLMLAMPIAILISSIMTFGNLGESFELVAIKSAGISLLRFMRPIMWLTVFLCGITFLFANYVIPYANLKFVTLYNDIYVKKPAFDLKEGVFFTYIPNYAIKVGKKDDDGKTIHNVVIFEQNNSLQDNCIVAEKGEMKMTDDENYLEFNLENGYRYQERGNRTDTSTEFTRLGFKSFKKLFDLSILKKQNTNDSIFKNNFKMLSFVQLSKNIDSLKLVNNKMSESMADQLKTQFRYDRLPNAYYSKSATLKPLAYKGFIPKISETRTNQYARNKLAEIKNTVVMSSIENEGRRKEIIFHKIELQRKFSLSLACMVLFFIGAPLGAIIRKGGLGMPLVTAIIFFLIFHLLNMFGEKFVRQDILDPFTGMWLAIIALMPVGFFLTYKAMHDSQLFNKEYYSRMLIKLKLALPYLKK